MESSKNKSPEAVSAAVEASLDRAGIDGARVVVGFSGGMDSSVLLHALHACAGSRRLQLAALHVHHGLSSHADDWEEHCRATCSAWRIPLTVERAVVERGSSDGLEAAARRARHATFADAEADLVALAHHRDDQAETLLFNLLRGTGLAGAAAMAERSGRLLRPLLGVARHDIARYAERHALMWIEDESNRDTRFSRNHLRHETLANLEQRFPGSSANLAAATRRFGEARQLLDELAVLDIGNDAAGFPVELEVLRRLSEPRARNVLRYLLQQAHIGIPSEERLREILRQFLSAAQDRHPSADFGGWRLFRRQGRICVEPVQDDAV